MLIVNINQGGTYRVEFNKSDNTPMTTPSIDTQTIPAVAKDDGTFELSIANPDGSYIIPRLVITNVADNRCTDIVYNINVNCIALPICGCGENSPFSILAEKVGNNSYDIVFNSCNTKFAYAYFRRMTGSTQNENDPILQTYGTQLAPLGEFTSPRINVTIPTITQSGFFYFQLIGVNCEGQASSLSFPINVETSTGCIVSESMGEYLDLGRPNECVITNAGTSALLTSGTKKVMMDSWAAVKGKGFKISVYWDELETSSTTVDSNMLNNLYAIINYAKGKGMKLIIAMHMSIKSSLCSGNTCPSHLYNIYTDGMKTSGNTLITESGTVALSMSSLNGVNNMQRFWNKLINFFSSYKQDIIFTVVTNETTKGCHYPLALDGDYNSLETGAYTSWQQTNAYTPIYTAPMTLTGLEGARWLAFKSSQLRSFSNKWGNLFKNAGFTTLYSGSSLTGSNVKTGLLAVPTDALKTAADGLIDEHYVGSNVELQTALLMGYNSGLNALEFSYNSGQSNLDNVNRMYDAIVKAKQNGLRITIFKGFELFHNTTTNASATLTQLMQKLDSFGWVGKSKQCSTTCSEITFYSDAAKSTGYNITYNAPFNSVKGNCGDKYIIVKVVDNLVITNADATINYFLYEPTGGEDNFVKLRIVKVDEQHYRLLDEGNNQGLTVYYKINGASNPSDARVLTSVPIPRNREIHFLKYGFGTSVKNINSPDPNDGAFRIYYPEDASRLVQAKTAQFLLYI